MKFKGEVMIAIIKYLFTSRDAICRKIAMYIIANDTRSIKHRFSINYITTTITYSIARFPKEQNNPIIKYHVLFGHKFAFDFTYNVDTKKIVDVFPNMKTIEEKIPCYNLTANYSLTNEYGEHMGYNMVVTEYVMSKSELYDVLLELNEYKKDYNTVAL